jgi:hypothetical protein
MFIRKTKIGSSGNKNFYSHRLVETYRDANNNVKQPTLLYLGAKYEMAPECWPLLCSRIEDILRGQGTLMAIDDTIEREAQRLSIKLIKKQGQAIIPATDNDPVYEEIDINNVTNSEIKSVGSEQLAYAACNKLNIPNILSGCGFSNQDINTALASIIGRLLYPGSEVSTARELRKNSGLDEVLNDDFSKMHKNKLYKISDELLKNQVVIEKELYNREKELFNLKEIVTLYDLTNTYFEGSSLSNENAAHGRSKEKRSDRPIVSLALVLDGSGFPKKSRIYEGNVSECKTLEAMISDLETKDAIIVMDAGIATEENITWLGENGYKYLVISRKRQQDIPNTEGIVVKDDPKAKVTTFLTKNGKESELYCHSEAMEHKSKEMNKKYVKRFEEELQKLKNGLSKKGCTKKYDKVNQRIGRLKEKYSKIASAFIIEVKTDDKKNIVTSISWTHDSKKKTKQEGIYCIRTNQTELNNQQIWDTYRMLNSVESAFRHLKTDLGLRPIYHQTTNRVRGHIFISVLAYHLLHSIRYQLLSQEISYSWQTIMNIMKSHYRVTTLCKNKTNQTIYIRKSMYPDQEQCKIYKACNLSFNTLPSKIIKY